MKRSDFIKANLAALGGVLLAGNLLSAGAATAVAKPSRKIGSHEVKLGLRVSPGLSEQQLEFMSQLGLKWCRLDVHDPELGYDGLARVQETLGRHGIGIFSVINYTRQKPALLLGGPERDTCLQAFARDLEDMGRLGIPVCDTSWLGLLPGSQVFTTSTADLNGIPTRIFDVAEYEKKAAPPERRLTADEVRGALGYFLKQVMPVAEASHVLVAFHPDDPPIAEQGGVARVLHTADHFRQLFELCDSPNLGVNFCVGTWAEAGDTSGKPLDEAIRWFAAQGRLFDVHLRNIRGVLPRFQETFIDNGDLDMQAVMNTLVEVGFDGLIVPDHIPEFTLDKAPRTPGVYRRPFQPAGIAYSVGCMRTMLRNAEQGRGGPSAT